MSIPGLPLEASQKILAELRRQPQPQLEQVVLYGSRAMGRQRSGSDVELCLLAPEMTLADLLELGARLDDLLLPWRIDLQLDHLIAHPGLRDHIKRVGLVLWSVNPEAPKG